VPFRDFNEVKADGSTGTPTQFAQFPGTYKLDDPGINIPDGTEKEVYADFMKYGPAPGPPVWTG
jgi:hypothetical protein